MRCPYSEIATLKKVTTANLRLSRVYASTD